MADPIAHPAVRRVQAALAEAGSGAEVIALASTARSAEDAAASIDTPLGSIVKSLVFTVAGTPVMALVAGDRRCDAAALAAIGPAAITLAEGEGLDAHARSVAIRLNQR